jgi:hypothetical protein
MVIRIFGYGSLLGAGWWWMIWTPGSERVGPLGPLSSGEAVLEAELRADVRTLAEDIGERNVPDHARQLNEAAEFISRSFTTAGYQPASQWYDAGPAKCRNLEVEIPGIGSAQQIVIIGAHYDSVPGSPGADDNASGVAALLALARRFVGSHPERTVRFVAFANEEPPFFWTDKMGSLVYAAMCRQRGDQVVAMISLESLGFYSTVPRSQRYPAGLGLLYPSTGDFVAFVGNLKSRSLIHEVLRTFRGARVLPSIGAAIPNAVPGAGWSDHWSFWQQGFPAIEITDTAPYRNPHYHSAGDTVTRVDYDRLARFTWGMRAVLRQLAGASLKASYN